MRTELIYPEQSEVKTSPIYNMALTHKCVVWTPWPGIRRARPQQQGAWPLTVHCAVLGCSGIRHENGKHTCSFLAETFLVLVCRNFLGSASTLTRVRLYRGCLMRTARPVHPVGGPLQRALWRCHGLGVHRYLHGHGNCLSQCVVAHPTCIPVKLLVHPGDTPPASANRSPL